MELQRVRVREVGLRETEKSIQLSTGEGLSMKALTSTSEMHAAFCMVQCTHSLVTVWVLNKGYASNMMMVECQSFLA